MKIWMNGIIMQNSLFGKRKSARKVLAIPKYILLRDLLFKEQLHFYSA